MSLIKEFLYRKTIKNEKKSVYNVVINNFYTFI